MNDVEHLKMMDLEDQLKFAREKNIELKKEIKRLQEILNGEDVIKNSLSDASCPFNHLKSSYRHRKT